MALLGIDFETASACSIKLGAPVYAAHASTRMLCAVLILREEDRPERVCRWLPGDQLPPWAVAHLESGGPILAHNAGFEDAIIRHLLHPYYGWPETVPGQWRDSARIAAALNLPRALDAVAKILNVSAQKDMAGKDAMLKLSIGRWDEGIQNWLLPVVTGDDQKRLLDYCEQDVRATFDVYGALPKPPLEERLISEHDMQVNRRGCFIDTRFALAMRVMARRRTDELKREMSAASEFELAPGASVSALKAWLKASGIEVPTRVKVDKATGARTKVEVLDRAAIDALLTTENLPAEDDVGLPPSVKEVLRLRVEAGRATSLAKLASIDERLAGDGRLREALLYGGAHTGRWASVGAQLHNLPRPRYEPEVMDAVRAAIEANDYEALQQAAPSVLESLSYALRSVVAAAPGCDLIGGDFSAVEARGLAWLAGQHDVLDMFANGVDVYTEDARKSGSTDRQFGKVQRLALGYGMGPVKFIGAAAGYGVTLTPKQAREGQQAWRKANPKIVQFWADLEAAFHELIPHRSGEVQVGWLRVVRGANLVRVVMPSGRSFCYWRPSTRTRTRQIEVVNDAGEIARKEVELTEIAFWKPKKTAMVEDHTYGGKLAENVTQALCRDVLGAALLRLETTIYRPVMHVHDSVATEVPAGAGSLPEFIEVMAKTPAWAPGLPMKVDAYRSRRFKG